MTQNTFHKIMKYAFFTTGVAFCIVATWLLALGYKDLALWISLAVLTCFFVGEMNGRLVADD